MLFISDRMDSSVLFAIVRCCGRVDLIYIVKIIQRDSMFNFKHLGASYALDRECNGTKHNVTWL